MPPDELTPESVLRLNSCEKILWTVQDSETAQTYIPDWGLSAYFHIGWRAEDTPRPVDGLVDAIMEACGSKIEITGREWKVKDHHPIEPPRDVVNGTFGRPTSWINRGKRCTWGDIVSYLQGLGYEPEYDRGLKIKIQMHRGRADEVVHASSRFQGSLAILRVKETLVGGVPAKGGGDLLDPDYHHAAGWVAESPENDFLLIGDYCQTENYGNVGHTSVAVSEAGLAKLEVVDIIPALHHEWAESTGGITLRPSPEFAAWQEKNQFVQKI